MSVLVFLLIAFTSNGHAADERYPAFGRGTLETRSLKALPINKPEAKGLFRDKDVSVSWETKVFESSTVEIRYKGKLIEKIELPGGREWSNFLGNIYYTDLDHNELPDIVLAPEWYGSGLGSFDTTTDIYFQVAPGKFRRLEFTSFYFEITDFVSSDKDGGLELLMMRLAYVNSTDGKAHSYWVYVPYKIRDFNLVIDKDFAPDFPKFIWYSKKENSEPTDKLSSKVKNDFLASFPPNISSVQVSE